MRLRGPKSWLHPLQVEYGKQVRGTLIVLTDEMQWSYEVRGAHPQYEAPQIIQTKVDHVLDPQLASRLGRPQKKNFLKYNALQVRWPR